MIPRRIEIAIYRRLPKRLTERLLRLHDGTPLDAAPLIQVLIDRGGLVIPPGRYIVGSTLDMPLGDVSGAGMSGSTLLWRGTSSDSPCIRFR